MRQKQRVPRPTLVLLIAIGAWLAVEQVHNIVSPGVFVWRGIDDVVTALAGVLCLSRARGPERAAWRLIGAGILVWAAGDVYWSFVLADAETIPIPSWADAGYLAFCPL